MMTDGHVAIEAMDLLLRGSSTVSGTRVEEWLVTRDPDVLSVIYEAIAGAKGRIEGGVSPEVYFELVKKLFDCLLARQGNSEYALTQYDAGRVYAAFLVQCAKQAATDPRFGRLLHSGAAHLGAAYEAGSESQKRCIVDGVVEHVVRDANARSAFVEWSQHPVLRRAYKEALEFGEE
jgi:hypothetical protein